jgi:hypothetical protein
MPSVSVKRVVMGQLPHGSDLYAELTRIAQANDIRLGRIQGIGATTHAVVAYYDQNARTYIPMVFPGGMEILNLSGNISLRDGNPSCIRTSSWGTLGAESSEGICWRAQKCSPASSRLKTMRGRNSCGHRK